MLVCIASDSHNNMDDVEKLISYIKDMEISAAIHCGDICKPEVLLKFEKSGIFVNAVFGNMDNRDNLTKRLVNSDYVKLFGYIGEFELKGRKIAFMHNLQIGEKPIGKYDAVFYGHTHIKEKRFSGKTLIANPGEIAGLRRRASFAVYDTKRNNIEFVEI